MDLFENRQALGLLVLRVIVGIVFFVHGLQKLFVFGFAGTIGFVGSLGIPAPAVLGSVLLLAEVLCGLALILGLYTRWVTIPLAIDNLVALFVYHLPNGFFATNQGYEFVLTLFAANVAFMLIGAGTYSLDARLLGRPRLAAG
jgi:putative oxidoreductase